MPISEGATTTPLDSAGTKITGFYDGTNLWIPRVNANKDSRVALYDAAGNALLVAAAALADGASLPTTTKVGAVLLAYDGTNLDLVRTVEAGTNLTNGLLGVGLYAHDGTDHNRLRVASFVADGVAGNESLTTSTLEYNGATFDRRRANWSATVLPSAARTVATSTGALVNYNGRGIQCDVTVTAKAAATTLSIQLLNPAGATLATSGAIAAAVGAAYSVAFYPGVLAAAYSSSGQGLQVVVPRDYILVVTPSDANSVTYSLNVQTVL